MAKTIQITDVAIKEVQISLTDGETSINVLYALVSDDGKEYSRQWRTFKGERIAGIIDRLERVLEKAIEKVKEDEGI
jgi:hypothetical protein